MEEQRMKKHAKEDKPLVNCLRKERVIVRYIPKESGMISDPHHILYGGMAENATRTFVVPRLSSGLYVNVLTDAEKAYLEEAMGLEFNALSIYKKNDNFWDDSYEGGISTVTLRKQDNYLDLSNPEDYIRYKILLANKDYIAKSLKDLEDHPKATYQFVIFTEGADVDNGAEDIDINMKCYKEYGKIEHDVEKLRLIVETLEGKPTAKNVKVNFLKTRINKIIQSNGKSFLNLVQDPLLDTKVLIRKALDAGAIIKRGDFYYFKSDKSSQPMPLCGESEDPTFNVAATYLNLPKNQQLKFSIETKIKDAE